jgi:hypothetical protein
MLVKRSRFIDSSSIQGVISDTPFKVEFDDNGHAEVNEAVGLFLRQLQYVDIVVEAAQPVEQETADPQTDDNASDDGPKRRGRKPVNGGDE